jgi:hypothetical protein
MSALQRIDHGLARQAAATLDRIRDVCGGRVSPQVITRLKGLPVLLRTSGTLATLAFFAAKGGQGSGEDGQGGGGSLAEAYATVGAALRREVCAALGWAEEPGDPNVDSGFLKRLTDEQVSPIRLAVANGRLEEYAGWLRRLAEAVELEQQAATAAGGQDRQGDGDG